jgi:hypothetical protein
MNHEIASLAIHIIYNKFIIGLYNVVVKVMIKWGSVRQNGTGRVKWNTTFSCLQTIINGLF